MDFFDFLFGKKKEKDNSPTTSLKKETSSEVSKSARRSVEPAIEPVEQYVKESVNDLKKHISLDTKSLEAEAIYLAAFLYMKGSYQIDFNLDYLSSGLLDKIPSNNFTAADKVFSYMVKYGEGHYGAEERDYGINGYKMNIQMCSDYGGYIKNYFIRVHKIESGKDFHHFCSPRNCLWKNGIKAVDSPTQRDIYYKFDKGTFEFMIPPYNPLVAGHARKIDETTLKCESNDGKRTFIFHFDGALKPSCLNYIEMYRNDKGDMVSYHKEKEDNNASLNHIDNFDYHFHKMMCTLKKKGERFGTMFIIEDPLKNNVTVNLSYANGRLTLDIPEIDQIQSRGGIKLDNHIEILGSFEDFNYDSNSTCKRLFSNGIDVKIISKRGCVFSFVEIPIGNSSNPQYRGYDTLSFELDLTE